MSVILLIRLSVLNYGNLKVLSGLLKEVIKTFLRVLLDELNHALLVINI